MYGRTPLYYACLGGKLELVQYLLSLNVKHSDINMCLEAAIESNNPEVAWALINAGAEAIPPVWEHAMSVKRTGRELNLYIEIIDLLLSTKIKVFPRASVLTAIDKTNSSGLRRVLEKRNGNLGFDGNDIFQDRRWSGVAFTVQTSTLLTKSGSREIQITRDDLYNCLAYAEENDADDIVALLKSYGWTSKKQCGPNCEARFGSRYDRASKPPHDRRKPRQPLSQEEVLLVRAGRYNEVREM